MCKRNCIRKSCRKQRKQQGMGLRKGRRGQRDQALQVTAHEWVWQPDVENFDLGIPSKMRRPLFRPALGSIGTFWLRLNNETANTRPGQVRSGTRWASAAGGLSQSRLGCQPSPPSGVQSAARAVHVLHSFFLHLALPHIDLTYSTGVTRVITSRSTKPVTGIE